MTCYLQTNYEKHYCLMKRYNELKKRIPMGCFDGVEVCDLVGTYILNKLNNFFFKATHLVYVEMTG